MTHLKQQIHLVSSSTVDVIEVITSMALRLSSADVLSTPSHHG